MVYDLMQHEYSKKIQIHVIITPVSNYLFIFFAFCLFVCFKEQHRRLSWMWSPETETCPLWLLL